MDRGSGFPNPGAPSGILFRPVTKTSPLVSEIVDQNPMSGRNAENVALASISRAQTGDLDAFESLYRQHSGRVYALCLRLVAGDKSDATELMQDVFVRAWRSLATFRGDCAFSSWLHRLAVNTMLENVRSQARREARVLPMDDTSRLPGAARTSGLELKMDMEAAVASLPKGARLAFVLHDVEGYQHQEIAQQLGISVGTVKAQLHRARRLLREKLEGRNVEDA